jgi:hypothetical protein
MASLTDRVHLQSFETQTVKGPLVFKRKLAEDILPEMISVGFAFSAEFLGRAHRRGWRIAEVPITVTCRPKRRCLVSKYVFQVALETLRVAVALRSVTPRTAPTLETRKSGRYNGS